MEISSRNARMWARMGARAFYGQAFSDIASKNPEIIGMSADLGRSSGLDRFSKEYPDQFINVGIAEQNMVGVAAGIARCGFNVFATTFAPFASMRASEQVRMNMGYMKEPVKLVALGSGLAMGFLGNSHYGLEDISIMRAIPNLTVISPADCAEIYKTIEACSRFDKPVYIRLTGAINLPIVYTEEYEFTIGKAVWVKPVNDVTVISSGSTVGQALKAINSLEEKGCQVGLLNMHTIKPLDKEAIATCISSSNKIIVIEEHTIMGGLGSAILEHVNTFHKGTDVDIYTHGVNDRFVETGNYEYALEMNELDANGIQKRIELVL